MSFRASSCHSERSEESLPPSRSVRGRDAKRAGDARGGWDGGSPLSPSMRQCYTDPPPIRPHTPLAALAPLSFDERGIKGNGEPVSSASASGEFFPNFFDGDTHRFQQRDAVVDEVCHLGCHFVGCTGCRCQSCFPSFFDNLLSDA